MEHAGVLRCLEAIERQAGKRADEGLSKWSFFLGVFNVILLAYCFGAHRAQFWIIYLVESVVIYPIKYAKLAQNNRTAYFLDFCWVANFAAFAVILSLFFNWWIAAPSAIQSPARHLGAKGKTKDR